MKITTKCPNCEKYFTREIYTEYIIAGVGLELCPDCVQTDEHGNFIILVEEAYTKSDS